MENQTDGEQKINTEPVVLDRKWSLRQSQLTIDRLHSNCLILLDEECYRHFAQSECMYTKMVRIDLLG